MVAKEPTTVDRLNIALHDDSAEALAALQDRTGLKKVDLVNRALRLYEFIDYEMREGRELILRDAHAPLDETPAKEQLVKLFF